MIHQSSKRVVWLLAASLVVSGSVRAANNDWTGAQSSLVSNSGNWSLGHVPTSSEGHRVHAGFITGSKTVTFDTVLRPSVMFWCGAYAAQENNVTLFDPANSVCNPLVFEATDPTYGINQTGSSGHLRFCDNNTQNLALRIRGGTYSTTSELWLGVNGKAWFFVEDGALSCGGICYIANNGNAYSDVTLAGGTLTTGGDLVMGGSGATARLTVGGGEKPAVVTVPLNKWAKLSNDGNVSEAVLTLKAGGTFHCGFLKCTGANSTVVFDGGTFVKDDDVAANATSQGYVLGFGGNDAQDMEGRRVLFTANGGTLELTKADGWIKSEVALAGGATAATLTKRGRGVLRLANLGEGLSAVIEDGGIEVTQGQFEQVAITGGKIPFASIPAHKGQVVVTGGKILLSLPFDGVTDGTAIVTAVNVADFDFQNGLTAADVFAPADSISLSTFSLGVNGEGFVTLTPTRRALPRGYTAIEYIESNGHQFINTGWIHSPTTRVECVLNASNPGWEWRAAFGARNVTFRENCLLFFTRNGNGDVCYSRTNNEMAGTGDSKVFPFDSKVKIVCERSHSTWTWTENGVEKKGGIYTTGTVDGGVSPIFIFGLNGGTSATALDPQKTSRACQKLYGFRISEGETVVRDFVPVLSPRGEPGLYDFVTQSFYSDGGGEEGFVTPSAETAFYTGYIDSSNGKAQYINTGYTHTSNTKVEADVNVGAARSSTSWEAIFGSRNKNLNSNAMVFFAWANKNPRTVYNRSGAETVGGPIFSGVRTFLTCEGKSSTWYQVGNPSLTGSITSTGTANDGANKMYIFDLNTYDGNGDKRDNSYLRMQLYSFKISESGVVKRDFVGYHQADGTVGLVDLANADTFYPSANGENFLYGGERYQIDGTTLTALCGDIPAARLTGATTIVKKDLNLANVAAAPTSLAALTVSEGGLTFQDGTAKTYAISGALTLAGDAALTLDVTADGADRFTVGSLVLDASVTAEQPVKVNLAASGVAEVVEPIMVLAGGNLTSGDLAKFALFSDIPAQLEIENGDLKIVAKEVGAVTFIGGTDGNWSTVENWLDGETPQTGAKVNVAATAGGTMAMDINGLSVKTLQYGADAGSFALGGSALGITTAITNLSAAAQTLTLPLTLGVGQDFSISTTGDMALTGQITPNFTTLAKGGAGELTLEDMAVNAAHDVTVDGGTLTLRPTSTPKPSSDGQGKIQIAAGSQLKVNIGNGNSNLASVEPTHAKTVFIAGDGPDGEGALFNANPTTATGEWSATFSHVVLTGDASVGGGAMGIREAPGSAIPDAQLSGGHTLTVRTSLTSNYGFTFYSTAFAIDRIVNEGHLQIEGHAQSGTVTNGIHLTDGSLTKIFDTTIPATVPLVVDAGAKAEFRAASSDANTLIASLTVEDGATLTLAGDKGMKFNGVITNKGTIVKTTASTEYYFNGAIKGDGLLINSNGWLRIDRDYTDDACRMRVDSGNVRFGGDATGVPLVPPALEDLCGNAHFFFGQTTTIGSQYDTLVAQATAHQKEIGVFTRNNAELILKGATWNLYDLTVADDNNAARLVIDEGSTVTASHQVRNGGSANSSKNGVLELKAGGKLATPGVNLIAGSLVQTGGELEIGANGLAAGKAKSVDDPHFRFEGGTLKAMADFSVGSAVSTVFGGANFFDSSRTAAEGCTIDLNGKTVNWSAPLFGTGPLTLTGAGSFLTQANPTKYPMGTVTVATDPTATVNLSGVDAFTDGLTLAADAKATVKCSTVPSIERGRFEGNNLATWVAAENIYDSVVADFNEMNAASGSPKGTFYISYRGQFYVPADKAGEWHFIGGYDDASYLEIDGTQVGEIRLDNDWSNKKTGSRELVAGWHDFRLFFGQHTGGWGTILNNGKGKYAFGWTTDASARGSTDGSKYEAFDPTTLEMRLNDHADAKAVADATASTVRWQHDNRGTSSNNNLDDWMETTTTYNGTDQVLTTVKDLLCSTSNTQLKSRRNRLSGYVYIPTTGTWMVKGKFDDKFCLRIDGEIAVWYGSFDCEFANDNLPLAEGWHFFDIQLADTFGGYGATFTDSKGQICAVAFCAPGSDQYLAFTEDNFKLRAFLPGLGGVTTLAAGSTLTSESSAYPIRGVLAGTGALAGGFVFQDGTWRVTANAWELLKNDITGVTNSEFLRSLRKVEIVLAEQAKRKRYELCAAGGLTDAEAAEITVTAVAAEGVPAVRATDSWWATVSNGVLWLNNPHPAGFVLFVR